AAATAIAVVAAAWSTLERGRATASLAPPDELFPGLIEQVNDIARIDVHTPKLAFTIERTEVDGTDSWRVKERDGYPVKFATIKQAVVGMASMRMLEAKTAKPELHNRLFLKSPKDGGRGTTIALADGAGKALAAIVVGKTKSEPSENDDGIYYVRRLDQAQSYLAAGRVEVWETIDRWLDDSLPTIARKRIRAATTIQPNGDRVGVVRKDPDAGDFQVADIPPGMKPLGDTIGNALGSSLGFLDFKDVRLADKIDFSNANVAEFKTFDGVSIKLSVIKGKNGRKEVHWMRMAATFDAADSKLDGLTDAQKKVMKSEADAKVEVAEINKRYGAWAYVIPDYKAKDYMTEAATLLIKDEDTK
ncbi:MAG: DUF4340 domain-containing protein, partial [Rhodospirillaceae bacterium]|nr:DUF4340 domain-containing protein [Rhodospirillaceae bacterium]